MKISILLPYKENFTNNNAGAVSLFVNDITRYSYFRKNIEIFGNTNFKNYLSKNYTNLDFDKKFFLSSNKQYVDSFLNYEKKKNSDLIEVHNRPSYIKEIKKNYNQKLFLYFHNDPLQMSGSKLINDRTYLIENVDIIFFNSEWCRKRFFTNIKNKDVYFKKTAICYQSSSKTKIDFTKKKKIISFVGKLNSAKGYDLFGEAIIKILDKHKSWSAHIYGDEPREKLEFKHNRLKMFGFKNNKYILNDLKKISISVVCSRWEEPFGRTSLEAASRGSAVIISNRGGLPETTPYSIKLKSLSSESIFNSINDLILNSKKLKDLQRKNFQTFKFTHKFIANIIDKSRKVEFINKKINLGNIKKRVIKIIHITNFNRRFDGRLHYNTSRRLNNGFIRLGHNVLTISDRDLIHENKNVTDFNGKKTLQKKIIKTFENFKADCIILGHADSVSNETLAYLKKIRKDLKIAQWFLDPLSKSGPDYLKNNLRISQKLEFMNNTFITSCPFYIKAKN
jgi:glycosyltransferase involved in cell wall biosynthesis